MNICTWEMQNQLIPKTIIETFQSVTLCSVMLDTVQRFENERNVRFVKDPCGWTKFVSPDLIRRLIDNQQSSL